MNIRKLTFGIILFSHTTILFRVTTSLVIHLKLKGIMLKWHTQSDLCFACGLVYPLSWCDFVFSSKHNNI